MKGGIFSRKAILAVSAAFAKSASDIAVILVLVRYLSKEAFGLLREVILVLGSVLVFSNAGLPNAIAYFSKVLGPQDNQNRIQTCIKFVVFLNLGITLILAAIGFMSWCYLPPSNLLAMCLLAAPFPGGQGIIQALMMRLIATNRDKEASAWGHASALGQGFAFILPAIAGAKITTILLSAGAFWLIAGLSALLRLGLRHLKIPLNRSHLSTVAKFVVPVGINSALVALNSRIDRYYVAWFGDVEQFAIYAVGAIEIPLVGILTLGLSRVMLPELSGHMSAGRHHTAILLWNKVMIQVAAIIFPTFFFLLYFAPELYHIAFTATYVEASPIFRIYLGILPFRIAAYGIVLQSMQKTRDLIMAGFIAVVSNLVVGYTLYQLIGPAGAACGATLSNILMILYLIRRISNHLRVPLSSLIPLRSLTTLFALAAFSLFVIYLPRFAHSNELLTVLVGAGSFTVIYCTLLVILRRKIFLHTD